MALSAGFEKHAIIGGCVDSFCLVCNTHLRTYDEVIVHTEKPIHKKNLDSAQFNEKYKEDKILKVREGYFCMFCCILLSTIRKVGLHVTEPQHISNKGMQLLKRFGAFITAYDEIFITNAAWGGIMDGSCAICDVEVTDEKRHETESIHVLNVIRSEVEFGEGRQIYRKVDDNSIYCITCNEIFSKNASKSHFNELEHNNKLEECKNAYKTHKYGEENNNSIEPMKNSICTLDKEEIQNVDRISTSSSEGFNTHSPDDETDDVSYRRQTFGPISSSLDKFEKNGIYIDIKNFIAYCVKCTENVDFNCKAINKHIEEHDKPYKERNDSYALYLYEADTSFNSRDKPEREENERYGQISSSLDKFEKNRIYIDIKHSIAYCLKCTENVDFNCKAINKHIEEHDKPYKERNDSYFPYLCEADTSFISRDKPEREENDRAQSAIASQDTDSDSDKQATLTLSDDINHVYANETVDTDNNVSEITDDPITFAKTNTLTYNKDNPNAYCRICEVKLPAHIKSMREHVSGKGHKKNVSNETTLANTEHGSASNTDERFIEKTLTMEFVTEAFTIRTALVTEVIINYTFCLKEHSFNMITRTGVNLRCEMCEEYLVPQNVAFHMYREWHVRALHHIPILTSLHKEFVREVRSGVYHCGFCNLVAASWDNLQRHLACSEHRDAKLKADVRLALQMPAIYSFKLQSRIQEDSSPFLRRII